MTEVFVRICNMSLIASWMILAVIVLRVLFKKAPKWMICGLWILVGIRLLIPIGLESRFSLIPNAQPIPKDVSTAENPKLQTGISFLNDYVNEEWRELSSGKQENLEEILRSEEGAFWDDTSVFRQLEMKKMEIKNNNKLQIWMQKFPYVWLVGMVLFMSYGVFSYLRIRNMVQASVRVSFHDTEEKASEKRQKKSGMRTTKQSNNLFVCDEVKTPFILGILRPKIYMPSGLNQETLESVCSHEQAHIQRKDHIWKPFGFFLLTIYWFNPLCWVAYILLCRDIELACDERAIRNMEARERALYCQAMLECSMPRRMITACPVAFGEVGVKQRVRNVVHYKKPAVIVILLAIIACAVVTVCFATNPPKKCEITFQVPAKIEYQYVTSQEQISPTASKVTVWNGKNMNESVVIFMDMETGEKEMIGYLDGGLKMEVTLQNDHWYAVEYCATNASEKAVESSLFLRGVEVRCADVKDSDGVMRNQDYFTQEEAEAFLETIESKGQLDSCASMIREQYASYDPANSHYPGSYEKTFQTLDAAKAYTGYENLKFPAILQEEQSVVTVEGNELGELQRIEISTEKKWNAGMSCQSKAIILTEKEAVGFSENFFGLPPEDVTITYSQKKETYSGKEVTIVNASGFEEGWLTQDVFWVDDTVVYELDFRYQKEYQEQVDVIMQEWIL